MARTPATGPSRDLRSVRSPRTTSTPFCSRGAASVPGRTSARTGMPRARRWSTTRPPRFPVAPTTRTGRASDPPALFGVVLVFGFVADVMVSPCLRRRFPAFRAVFADPGQDELVGPGDDEGEQERQREVDEGGGLVALEGDEDRKSTRLNSS